MSDGMVFGDWLAGLPVGPELAASLASVEVTAVPNGSIIQYLRACARLRAHAEGMFLGAVASVLERDADAGPDSVARLPEPDWFAPDEVRAALVMSLRRAVLESEFAYDVCRGLPAVHAQMLAGRVDRERAQVFAQHLAGLPGDLVAKVLDALLPEAPGLTTGQLRARILKMILTADPDRAQVTYEQALAARAVVGYLNPDGTATVTACGLPPDEAAAATERIAGLARAAQRAGHPGLADQLRADIYLRLLDGRFHHLTRAEMIAALLAQAAPAKVTQPANPAGKEPARTEPDGTEPDPAEPDPAEPDPAEPDPAEPAATEPAATEPGSLEPDGAEPDGTESDGTESDGAQPRDGGPRDPGPDTVGPGGAAPGESCGPVGFESAAAPGLVSREDEFLGRVAGIEVRARLDSLAGINQLPGEIPGWGPIPASVTRQAVARQHHGQWRWVVTDHHGYLITEGLTRHRPTTGPPGHHADGGIVELAIPATVLARLAKDPPPEWAGVINDIATRYAQTRDSSALDGQGRRRFPGHALRRHVQIRDRTCTAPGCRRPATQSEQDHTHDHQHGGTTTHTNLGPACHHDHHLKHDGGWNVAQPRPGRFIWTSPLGRRYPTRGERITEPEPD